MTPAGKNDTWRDVCAGTPGFEDQNTAGVPHCTRLQYLGLGKRFVVAGTTRLSCIRHPPDFSRALRVRGAIIKHRSKRRGAIASRYRLIGKFLLLFLFPTHGRDLFDSVCQQLLRIRSHCILHQAPIPPCDNSDHSRTHFRDPGGSGHSLEKTQTF